MIDTARLIITLNCNRDCVGCCNKDTDLLKQAIIIRELPIIRNYPIIVITGGEPLLNSERTIKIIQRLRYLNPEVVIYIYTALYNNANYENIKYIITWVNGVHYTLHYPLVLGDMLYFYKFQTIISEYPGKSFRLYIDNRIDTPVIINPNLWHRVEIKAWMKKCPLPDNEKLFILNENYDE